MIYLDYGATTNKHPRCVVKAVAKTIKNSANPGRSGHNLSLLAGGEVFKARQTLNELFNGYGENNVIFTSSCTQSLNLAIQGTAKLGGHVVATMLDHNSILRPLKELKNKGIIDFSCAKPNKNGEIDLQSIKNEIKSNTYLIATTHISNLTGAKANIKSIGEFAKSKNILFLVDAAQSAGHEKIDIKENNISLFAIPSHKGLLGICGGGALIVNPKTSLKPIIFGGTGTSSQNLNQPQLSPEAFESGTLPTPAISSMQAGAKYVSKNINKIKKKIVYLSNYLIDNLSKNFKIKLYSKKPNGVIAFNVSDLPSTDVAQILNDEYGICTRAGLHCAPLAHETLGTTNQGAVRVSLSHFNTLKEIKYLINALKNITN